MVLTPIPAFSDNYIWAVHDGRHALVVDPGQAEPVMTWLAANGLTLSTLFLTHHHADHTGGVAELVRLAPDLTVYAPAAECEGLEALSANVIRVSHGCPVTSLDLVWQVYDVPGHTAGHVAYFCPDVTQLGAADGGAATTPVLFSGDTLFSGGCGRLFEGTAGQMHASLAQLAALPPNTLVCCAHEYTLSNLAFAAAVEPAHVAIADHRTTCQNLRTAGRPTLPSTIALERHINPFLRTSIPAVRQAALAWSAANGHPMGAATAQAPEEQVLAILREWKNRF